MGAKILDRFGEALQTHLDELTAEQRQEIRKKLQNRRTRSATARQGKIAFLYLLDEADRKANQK